MPLLSASSARSTVLARKSPARTRTWRRSRHSTSAVTGSAGDIAGHKRSGNCAPTSLTSGGSERTPALRPSAALEARDGVSVLEQARRLSPLEG